MVTYKILISMSHMKFTNNNNKKLHHTFVLFAHARIAKGRLITPKITGTVINK